jgi:hypothetical protein
MHDTPRRHPFAQAAAALALCLACAPGCFEKNETPDGLRFSPPSYGPRIVFDLDERPFPEIPFPNDLATRPDPDSPTGLRVNVSALGSSQAEERVRRYVNQEHGFGVFSPITVRFDAPLDVHDIVRRHQEPTPDLTDDAVYLVNVDPDSPEYGEFAELDMGRGNFPVTMSRPDRYFQGDPRSQGTNLAYESVGEADLNGNGVLDPIEDTDDDGVWDAPNTLDPGADPLAFGQLLDFYERETNTLVMRPIKPLAPDTTYAVVLTAALRGEDGITIDSPFTAINHARQTDALRPLEDILPRAFPARFDRQLRAVRFAWTFTTGDPTLGLRQARAGLYGHGPLAWLADAYPAEFKLLHTAKRKGAEEPLIFEVDEFLDLALPLLTTALGGGGGGAKIGSTFEDIDYVVSGSFLSPNFLVDADGRAAPLPGRGEVEPGDADAIDGLNEQNDDDAFPPRLADAGPADVGEDEVPFICVVPKPTATQSAPFPTIIYSHAIGSTRFEMLAFAGALAKFGMATCTIDGVGHGIDIPSEYEGLLRNVSNNLDLPNLRNILLHHRARDLDNDGSVETGGDYFTADLLHSRDMIRQTTIDQLQFIRILRGFDGQRRWPDAVDEQDPYVAARFESVGPWDADGDGVGEIAGDFNGDGVVDFGGDTTYAAWGTSLGGIQTTVLAGIEPLIRANASNAGGGGLGDIALRTTIDYVRVGVMLKVFGPLLVGEPFGGGTRLSWILPDVNDDRKVSFSQLDFPLEDGDRVVLRNPVREANPYVPSHERVAYATARDGSFRVGIAADAINATARRALLGFDPSVDFQEAVGCVRVDECGDQTCSGSSYCDAGGACAPLDDCLGALDVASLDEDLSRHVVADATAHGDPLFIEVYDANGVLKGRVDTFERGAVFQNVFYPPGSPLAALSEGWGLKRQTPRLRRFLGIGQTLLEPADPAIWASHYTRRPLTFGYEREDYRLGATNALFVGTLGDQTVPISASIALARAADYLSTTRTDERFGMTPNQFLVQSYVYEGISGLDRFPDRANMLFDPDDLDRGAFRSGRDGRSSPEPDSPLRADLPTGYYGGVSGLRLPYLNERGEHTFNVPNPEMAFDIHAFMINQVGWYLATGGAQISDHTCLADPIDMSDCAFYDPETFSPSLPLGPAR